MANITGVNPPVLNDEDYVDKIYDSFTAIDNHDHSIGKGKPITAAAITDGTITEAKLATVLANASKFLVRDAAGIVVSNTKAVPAGTVVGTSDAQSLTNKTLDVTNTITLKDTLFTLQDDGDVTKQFKVQLSGITAGQTRTWTVPDASDTFVGLATAQTLTSKTLTSPAVNGGVFDTLNMTEAAAPGTPSAGNLRVYAKTDSKLYTKNSAGTEAQVGAGAGGGSINYISANPDAESATTGWATYKDAAQSTPVDATGGSPTLTFTRSTSGPLRGTGSFLITTTAANLQGEGASYAFTIDTTDQAKMMSISFDYNMASGTYADGDMTVYIYDVTNALVIQPAGYSILGVATASYGKQVATFQTSSNSTSYRLVFHRAVSTASASTIKIDNVIVGPQIVQYGSPITDWQSFTPTGAFNTNTTYTGFWRRNGGDMEIQYLLSFTGAPNSVTGTLNLPSGYTIDTAKILATAANAGALPACSGSLLDFGVTQYPAFVKLATSTSFTMLYSDDAATGVANQLVTQAAPFTIGTGDFVNMNVSVPIVGWSSTVQMSNDTDTRVVAASAYRSANQTSINPNNSAVKIAFNVKTASGGKGYDTHGAFDEVTNNRFVAPVPGKYRMSSAVEFAATNTLAANYTLVFYRNGAAAAYGQQLRPPAGAGGTMSLQHSTSMDLVAGDYIEVFIFGAGNNSASTLTADGGVNVTYFEIERISGPSAIAASESVNARYSTAAGQSIANAATPIVDFGTKDFDTHNAVTTGASWKFTVPVAGKYEVSTNIRFANTQNWSVGTAVGAALYKNGGVSFSSDTALQVTVASLGTGPTAMFTGSINLVAGDTLDVRTSHGEAAARTLVAAGSLVWVCIKRIGN